MLGRAGRFGRAGGNPSPVFGLLAPNSALRATENPRVDGSIPSLATIFNLMIRNGFREDGIAVASVPAPQSLRISRPELVAPEADRLVGEEDASPGQDVLDVPVAQVEAVVEPDRVLNDRGRKSVPPV